MNAPIVPAEVSVDEPETSAYPEIAFDSISHLCELIDSYTQGWDTVWFRGTKSPDHALLPKLYREPGVAEREGYISIEFRRRAHTRFPNLHTPLDWLSAMQHFGLPTRLLDWTESLATALFFTMTPSTEVVSPTVWVLNPFELFELTEADNPIVPIATDPYVSANANIPFNDAPPPDAVAPTPFPVPLAPNFLFDRLAAQNGCFTIHGTDDRAVEELVPVERRGMLLKFTARHLDPNALQRLCRHIELVKPSSDSIFPDIEGLKDYIV